MDMLSNEKINFKSLEENTFKEMMKLGREIIQEELRMLDKLILDYRDKEIFVPKDFQPFGVLLWARQKVLGGRPKTGQMPRQSLGSRMWQLLLSARA